METVLELLEPDQTEFITTVNRGKPLIFNIEDCCSRFLSSNLFPSDHMFPSISFPCLPIENNIKVGTKHQVVAILNLQGIVVYTLNGKVKSLLKVI